MMDVRIVRMLAVSLVGLAYWASVSALTGEKEPWDASEYWTVAYPASLVLAALAGSLLRANAWLWGALITLAQLPVMIVNNGWGPLLWTVGFGFLFLLTIPAMAVSWLASRVRIGRKAA